jgi:DNA-binding NtrC family response regulator
MKRTSSTVLIVDDDATLRGALESILVPLGYRVLTTGEPDRAYALAGTERVDAALVDVRLPGMSGLSLYIALVHRCPALEGCIALMTGDADAADVRPWLERNHCTVFRKPFRSQQVTDWLDTALRVRDRKTASR